MESWLGKKRKKYFWVSVLRNKCLESKQKIACISLKFVSCQSLLSSMLTFNYLLSLSRPWIEISAGLICPWATETPFTYHLADALYKMCLSLGILFVPAGFMPILLLNAQISAAFQFQQSRYHHHHSASTFWSSCI